MEDCGWDGPAGGLCGAVWGLGEWDEEWAGGMSGAGGRVCGCYVRLACDEIAGKRSPSERSI